MVSPGEIMCSSRPAGHLARSPQARRRARARRTEADRAGAARGTQALAARLRAIARDRERRVRARQGPSQPPAGHRSQLLARSTSAGSSGNIGVGRRSRPRSSASSGRIGPDHPRRRTAQPRPGSPSSRGRATSTAVVQERDGLGDVLVPDYLTRIEKGAFYGWPYAYIGQQPQPDRQAAGEGEGERRPGPTVRIAFLGIDPGVLRRPAVPRGVPRRASSRSRAPGTGPTDQGESRAGAIQGRRRKALRELGDGVLGVRKERAEVWGRPVASRFAEERRPARGRRYRRNDLAGVLCEPIAARS